MQQSGQGQLSGAEDTCIAGSEHQITTSARSGYILTACHTRGIQTIGRNGLKISEANFHESECNMEISIPFVFEGEGMIWGGAEVTADTPIDDSQRDQIPGTPWYQARLRQEKLEKQEREREVT